jgi:hypothetical protein
VANPNTFYLPLFVPFFLLIPVLWLLWVSSLAYPNLLGTKRLCCRRRCCFIEVENGIHTDRKTRNDGKLETYKRAKRIYDNSK